MLMGRNALSFAFCRVQDYSVAANNVSSTKYNPVVNWPSRLRRFQYKTYAVFDVGPRITSRLSPQPLCGEPPMNNLVRDPAKMQQRTGSHDPKLWSIAVLVLLKGLVFGPLVPRWGPSDPGSR